VLSSAELYNPATGTWALTGSMNDAREGQTATLLRDGEVLVAGGAPAGTTFSVLSSAELYNPATGTWALTGSMNAGRVGQSATLLDNGTVLVAGGYNAKASAVTSAELYNPATGKWALTGSMTFPREGQQANLLNNGDVLVTAGTIAITNSSFSELYNPATGQWSVSGGAGGCNSGDGCLYSTATLLGDGDVLIAGGLTGTPSNPRSTAAAILYDPATNAWTTTGSMTIPRDLQTANLLTDGQVLVAGGEDFASHKVTLLASAELYTP
jgi:N-acetylneuraminic acid mutarotase